MNSTGKAEAELERLFKTARSPPCMLTLFRDAIYLSLRKIDYSPPSNNGAIVREIVISQRSVTVKMEKQALQGPLY